MLPLFKCTTAYFTLFNRRHILEVGAAVVYEPGSLLPLFPTRIGFRLVEVAVNAFYFMPKLHCGAPVPGVGVIEANSFSKVTPHVRIACGEA